MLLAAPGQLPVLACVLTLLIVIVQMIATASADASVCLWDTHLGRAVRRLQGHAGAVNHLAFLPYHRCGCACFSSYCIVLLFVWMFSISMIVSAGADHDAIVWNPLVETAVTTLTVRACVRVHVCD